MFPSRLLRLLPAIAALAFTGDACNANSVDWPMWRKDATHSGASSAKLPADLHLQWSRKFAAPLPAWPNESRLHFDASYEPIVMGSRMFVGSMVDGSVRALDCSTGAELWRFYTNGPVRLAPVAFDDRLCFGSDDGWLYCVDAESGTLIWKVSGAPEERGAFRHLGNARLASFWPVRGGPIFADGVVFFGAGIWPTLGVFIRAVDAESGRVIWTNDNSHALDDVRVDHNYLQESGLSPQGHMLVRDDMLIVPNGRSMPARLDRKTGKLHYFVQGYRNGDSRVVVSGDIALVGETGVVSLKDGREIASRWAEAGKDAPAGWSGPKADLFEGPLFPYKFSRGCDYRSVVDDGVAYGVSDGVVYAYDLTKATTSLQAKNFNGNEIKPARWDAPQLWKFDTPFAGKKLATKTLIRAGNRLYSHAGRTLFAVDFDADVNKPAAVAWTKELEAEPTTMLAAANRLFVATDDGAIHCFGVESGEPKRHSHSTADVESRSDEWTDIAKSAIEASDKHQLGGYAIVVGLKSGRLVEELLTRSPFHVIAIDDNPKTVNRLRRTFGADPRFHTRFQGIVDDPSAASLPPYLATLMVTEDPTKLRLESEDRLKRLYESLRPYGGTLCLPLDETKSLSLRKQFASSGEPSSNSFAGATAKAMKSFTIIRRTGALPGSSIWSHESGDAARSFYSRDELVKAPLAVLWYGDGRDHGFHKRKDYGHGLKPQVAGGRLFALQVATNTLKSVDAYTGRLLWSRKLGSSARYVSMPDAVFVADERTCLVLDPANGKPRATFQVDVNQPPEVPVSPTDIRVGDEIILISVRFNSENAISKGRWNADLMVALDRKSGEQLWSRPAQQRYNLAALGVADGRVFCIDSHSPETIGAMRRRGEDVETLPSTILAIEARSGRELWKVVRRSPPATLTTLHFMSLRTQDDWLAYSTEHALLLGGKGNQIFALDAKSGDEVWQKPMRGQQPLIVGPKTFINQTGHTYDVRTGDLVSGKALFKRGGCNYAVGGKNLLFLRSNCATYIDIDSRQEYAIRNLRSGCSNSLVAADGLLNAPCFSVGCICNYPIQTSFAMFHLPQSEAWHGSAP